MENNINNMIINNNRIDTIYQLKEKVNQLTIIMKKKEELRNDTNIDYTIKKINLRNLQEQENEIKSSIFYGISIQDNNLKNSIIKILIDFLKPYGFSEELLISNLSEIKLFTSDIEIGYGGLLVTVGNNIGIDYRYIIFDKDGHFKGFNEKDIPFLKYTLTHEFLHKCSAFRNDKQIISVNDDALSEGFTDMFALMSTNAYEYKSKNYDFIVKVCTILTNIIGKDKALDDYINNIGQWPNLKKLFNQIGLTEIDFKDFHNSLNEILELTFKVKNNEMSIEVLNEKRSQLIKFIRESILIPYLKHNRSKEQELTNLFNQSFIEYDINELNKSSFSK